MAQLTQVSKSSLEVEVLFLDYNIMCRERKEMSSRNDIDVGKSVHVEHHFTPTEATPTMEDH